ncbi:MAG: hypothetical protein V8Q75_02660 [Bacilli bacterium]
MKKLNNKGFMLVEILVVSVFISTVLVVLFVQFKKINKSYEVSFNYNTVDGLYLLDNVKRKIGSQISNYTTEINDTKKYKDFYSTLCPSSTYECNMIKEMGIQKLYLARKDAKDDMLNDKSDEDLTITFKDYLKYMSFKVYNTDYFLIAEFSNGTYASVNI